MIKKLISSILSWSMVLLAPAIAATVAVTVGAGTNFLVTTDGASNNISISALCGGASATLPTNCANEVQVDSSGRLFDNVAAIGGTSATSMVAAVNTAPVTATNPALTVDLRPDSPGITPLGQAANAASLPVVISSGQIGTAGASSAATLSVQGIASMTPLQDNIIQSRGTTLLGTAGTVPSSADPCSYALKSSAKISVSSATTTALVAVSGSTVVYVCGFDIMVAGSGTTAATAQLEYGSGAACATSPTALTGTYGSNDAAVSTTPSVVNRGDGIGTVLVTPASQGLCILTAGTTVFVQGSVTYVQQ